MDLTGAKEILIFLISEVAFHSIVECAGGNDQWSNASLKFKCPIVEQPYVIQAENTRERSDGVYGASRKRHRRRKEPIHQRSDRLFNQLKDDMDIELFALTEVFRRTWQEYRLVW
jgi:hypothetical protein